MEEQEEGTEVKEPEAPKKKRRWLKVLAVLAAVPLLLAGIFAGGMLAGPKLGGRLHFPGYVPPEPEPEEEKPPAPTTRIDPLVVDIAGEDKMMHYLKVGIAVELKEEVSEKEFELCIPRFRDAAIVYLRGLTYEKVSDPEQFATIKGAFEEHVKKSIGDKYVAKVLFTDFIVQ